MCNCNQKPRLPRERILSAAVSMTQTHGYKGATRDGIAKLAGVSSGLVNRYYGTMALLMAEVMRIAVEERNLPVVVQGLAHEDPVALAAPADVRAAAMAAASAMTGGAL